MTITKGESIESAASAGRRGQRAEMALFGVYEISKILTAPARLETTLASVLTLTSSFLDMRHGLIALIDEEGEPEMVVGSGWSEATAKRYFDRLPERAVGQIVVTSMPLVVRDVANDPLFPNWEPADWEGTGPCAFIGVPIKDHKGVIGTLTIDRDGGAVAGASIDEDVRFLTMIANLVGQTVRLQRAVARDRERLITEQHRLEKALESMDHGPRGQTIAGIVGTSPALTAVLDKVSIVARTHSTVLLRGESGTGKELFANAIHELSPRNKGPFIKLNCAALPESVLESELFGHEKGAFTGAAAQRKGRFEIADGGTLFLDEIGEISAAFQAKLLRVLQEGEFERVGGNKPIKVDVRVIAATNRNLEEAVASGEFRPDLYYRIAVVPIYVPPLRERSGDIVLLAAEFLQRFNQENGTELFLSPEALGVLAACGFPGNVRELENCVRRTATFAHGKKIDDGDFACRNDVCMSAVLWNGQHGAAGPSPFVQLSDLGAAKARRAASSPSPMTSVPAAAEPPPPCQPTGACPFPPGDGRSERDRLIEAMEMAGWVQAKAARLLGLTPRQIGYALRKYDVPIKHF